MTSEILLGVDIGTTDSKVLATTRTGDEVCLASGPTPWAAQPGGRADTDAADLADAVIALMARVASMAADRLGPVHVAGIGITGMAEVGVLVDAAGEPTHRAIAWFDPRGAAEMAAAPADFRAEFPGRTGLPVSSLASIAKLLWLSAHDVGLSGRRWLNFPEFLAVRLGAEPAGELSLVSRTGLLDQDGPALWPAALDVIGADASLVPPLVTAGTPLGRASGDRVPRSLTGAVVTVAGHDHPVAAVGCGVVGTDELFDSFGTADAMVRSVAAMPPPEARARLAAGGINAVQHVLAGRAVLLGGTKGGLILRRTLELLGASDGDRRAELDAAALAASTDRSADGPAAGGGSGGELTVGAPAAPGGVLVTGAANNDGTLRVTVDGDRFGPAALWLAALDNGAYEADRLLAEMAEFAGPVRRTVVAGGWIRMHSVRAAKAAALPGVEFSDRRQAGAFGAAAFAGHAAAIADAMAAAGDLGAVGITAPSGPPDELFAAFAKESDVHQANPASTTPVRTDVTWTPTTDELENTA